MFNTPVLLIIYKRTDTTFRVIDQLRKLRPVNLFVAADGPKNASEKKPCEETRALIETIDWDCRIQKLYQDTNQGVALGPKIALDWFFDKNEMGIILEDDILPSLDFFPFCEDLLMRYIEEPRVMHITAMNFLYGKKVTKDSYYFSRIISPWGWASWRRAWKLYDDELSDLEKYMGRLGLPDFYYHELLRCRSEKGKFTWDYQWLYTVLKNGGIGIVPTQNLALNIGFENPENASHTFAIPHWAKKLKLENLHITKHPERLIINEWADELTFKEIVGNYHPNYLKWFKNLFI